MHTILSDHLEQFLEGRLPAGLQKSVDSHLAECHSCRAELDDAMESSKLLRLLAVDEDDSAPEPLPGFSLKVMQGIEAAQASSPSAWWFSFDLLRLSALRQLAVATLALMLLAAGYLFTLNATSASTTAELLLDMPVEHEAPASLVAAQHHMAVDDTCLRCWQRKASPTSVADNHENREQALVALASFGD